MRSSILPKDVHYFLIIMRLRNVGVEIVERDNILLQQQVTNEITLNIFIKEKVDFKYVQI
jgi:hypothetical protein